MQRVSLSGDAVWKTGCCESTWRGTLGGAPHVLSPGQVLTRLVMCSIMSAGLIHMCLILEDDLHFGGYKAVALRILPARHLLRCATTAETVPLGLATSMSRLALYWEDIRVSRPGQPLCPCPLASVVESLVAPLAGDPETGRCVPCMQVDLTELCVMPEFWPAPAGPGL